MSNSKIEYVELKLSAIVDAYKANISSPVADMQHLDHFIDVEKDAVVLKVLATPNAEKLAAFNKAQKQQKAAQKKSTQKPAVKKPASKK